MNITLENVTVYIAIVAFMGGILRCVIISPLKDAIAGIQKALEKLEKSLAILAEKMDSQRERIALVEASTRSAHKRIDEMVGH